MLGIAIANRYERLVTASGEAEITVATVDLAQCMYENVEFVIWALKTQGGLSPPLPDRLNKISEHGPTLPANENAAPELPKMPEAFASPPTLSAECDCPPLEPGIIGNRHRTSCPAFKP